MNYEEMELELDQMLLKTRVRGVIILAAAIALIVVFMSLSIHLTQLIGTTVINTLVK